MSKLDRSRKLSEHFTLGEFISPNDKEADAYWATSPVTFGVRLERLCKDVLEPIRKKFGKPVTINSGLRSPAHNKRVGGASQSEHMSARAADIVVAGVSPAEVAKFCRTLKDVGGIGTYGSWCHVDIRPRVGSQIAEWDGP